MLLPLFLSLFLVVVSLPLLLVLFFQLLPLPMMVEPDPTPVPAIGFETPGDETSASTLVYALASLASSGQLQWDLEQAMTI